MRFAKGQCHSVALLPNDDPAIVGETDSDQTAAGCIAGSLVNLLMMQLAQQYTYILD
jgi:hypothetical protein